MDYSLAGDDQPQTNQPDDQAGNKPVNLYPGASKAKTFDCFKLQSQRECNLVVGVLISCL